MRIVKFDKYLDGIKRKANPKYKVNGYKHIIVKNIHFYHRGNIVFIVDMSDGCTIEKFSYETYSYLCVTFDDFHHFVDIEVV